MKLRGFLKKEKTWWIASVPSLDLASQGKTQSEAIEMVLDALGMLVHDLIEEHIELASGKLPDQQFWISTETPAPILCLMLKRLRQNAGVSVRKLAKDVGTKGANTVWQYERGTHEPSISKLQSFVQALGRDIELNIVDH